MNGDHQEPQGHKVQFWRQYVKLSTYLQAEKVAKEIKIVSMLERGNYQATIIWSKDLLCYKLVPVRD
jgi:hypothetical protein